MLKTRILTALVLIPLVLIALFLAPPAAWAAFVTLVIALAAWEWTRLSGMSGLLKTVYPVLTALAFVGLAFGIRNPLQIFGLMLGASLFWCVLAPLWLSRKWRLGDAGNLNLLLGWAVLLPAGEAMLILHGGVSGGWALLSVLAIAWVADTAAYFSGKAFGRRKLAPSISPGKSWEGVIGALIAISIYAICLPKTLFAPANLPVWAWVLVGWALTAVSIVGDLLESLFKRQSGIKDSSNLLPGHGGVLDRIDSLLAILPLATTLSLYPVLFSSPL
ncbi:phosphatidate cytidylyltransferase [Andreprevotia chitinilytica]|uniref:phosphatidate cytidylyltransferase n=1 Tax=Andreprevotia chitinilytica TaxID=396808 RepID=UPI0005542EA1|nr:phosphatidate cytidylyltransferase [Andreprevotia chitinilytica]